MTLAQPAYILTISKTCESLSVNSQRFNHKVNNQSNQYFPTDNVDINIDTDIKDNDFQYKINVFRYLLKSIESLFSFIIVLVEYNSSLYDFICSNDYISIMQHHSKILRDVSISVKRKREDVESTLKHVDNVEVNDINSACVDINTKLMLSSIKLPAIALKGIHDTSKQNEIELNKIDKSNKVIGHTYKYHSILMKLVSNISNMLMCCWMWNQVELNKAMFLSKHFNTSLDININDFNFFNSVPSDFQNKEFYSILDFKVIVREMLEILIEIHSSGISIFSLYYF